MLFSLLSYFKAIHSFIQQATTIRLLELTQTIVQYTTESTDTLSFTLLMLQFQVERLVCTLLLWM